jgi:hypothetical protein
MNAWSPARIYGYRKPDGWQLRHRTGFALAGSVTALNLPDFPASYKTEMIVSLRARFYPEGARHE